MKNDERTGKKVPSQFLGRSLSLAFLFAIVLLCPALLAGDGSITRSVATSTSSEGGLLVTITLSPHENSLSSAVEETIPAGCKVVGISGGGTVDSVNSKIKWIFLDGVTRALTYTLLAPGELLGNVKITGVGSFDGVSVPIANAKNKEPR